MEEYRYLLRVNCVTFNHSKFIKRALDGFCMQETSFPFVCVIVDDASTDGEQDVIKHYLETNFEVESQTFAYKKETEDYLLLFAQHKINKNCFFAAYLLKYNHYQAKKTKGVYLNETYYTKYVSICEGDDYWIDSKKLQIQVDFLDSHPNHTLCIHAYRCDSYQGDKITSSNIYKYTQNVDIIPDKDVINGTGMFGATASMVYRFDAIIDYPEWAAKAPVGDRPLKFVLFARGHIAYLNRVMSVYRMGVPGSWTKRVSRNHKAEKESRIKFIKLLLDFDGWTDQKYHKLVNKAICEYKRAYWKNDCLFVVQQLYNKVINLFKR